MVGSLFLAHGLQKLAGWFGGPGIAGTSQMMESLDMHPARLHVVSAGTAETLGGTLLLGFLMPLAAAAIIAVMFTAIGTVHFSKGFFNANGGYEFNLTLTAVGLSLACVGPGWLSLDNLLSVSWSSWLWALIALVVGVFGSTMARAMSHPTHEPETHFPAHSA